LLIRENFLRRGLSFSASYLAANAAIQQKPVSPCEIKARMCCVILMQNCGTIYE
jgi:hypothetical protein